MKTTITAITLSALTLIAALSGCSQIAMNTDPDQTQASASSDKAPPLAETILGKV